MRCDREGRDLPDEEFEFTQRYGWVHKRGRWHTTDGEDLDGGSMPAPAPAPPIDEPEPPA